MSSRVDPIAMWSDAAKKLTSGVEIAKLQRAVRFFDQLFDFDFSLIQLFRGLAQELDALLEQRERSVQLEPVAFELGDDLFQTLQVRFEGHAFNIPC